MSERTQTTGAGTVRGAFGRLGDFVVRWPLVVVGFWVLLAAGLSLTLPSLTQTARERAVAFVPANAPTMVATRQMTEAFHESGSQTVLLVVLTDEKGLGPADEGTYRAVVDKLRQDTRDVATLQDFRTTPILRVLATSKDHQAWYLPIGLVGELGSSQVHEASGRVADIVKHTVAGSTLTANLTGPAATGADLTDIAERDLHLIETATALMVLMILLIIYRNPVTMLLPLTTIGISMMTARSIVAGLAHLGLGISNETIILMTAIMAGAGIDYAVFLISRYHDYLRLGADSCQAVKRALTSIGKVIAASAATVAVTFLGMIFTRLGVFKTIGPALAIAIGVAFLAAVTLLPALLLLAGRRGWINPRGDLTSRFWRRSGIRIVRRPKAHLLASLTVLIILAGCAGMARYSYDDRKTLPDSAESSVGYAALASHFPMNSSMPQYLFVQSRHDLRNPEALAALEQIAERVSRMPDMAMVRGTIKLPRERSEHASVKQTADVGKLGHGVGAFPNSYGMLDALAGRQKQLGEDGPLDEGDDAAGVVTSMHALGFAIAVDVSDIASYFDGPVVTVLDVSPICAADPSCSNPRLAAGPLGAIADLAEQLQSTPDAQTRELATRSLHGALVTVANALRSMGIDDLGSVPDRVVALQQGSDALADAIRRLLDEASAVVDQTRHGSAGLADASAPLISPDGHSARYLIQTALNPFSTDAMDQVNSIANAARGDRQNTVLAVAAISVSGFTAMLRDVRDYYNSDIRFIIAMTILVVFLILIALLRAIVAPLYLIASVVISYLSALGVGVIVFRFILGQQLHWSVPALTFIILVAVGADYNMLLISRMRDEFSHGMRSSVIRTVGSTGGVITAAGVIFAASMFGLLFASISTMVQVGFVMGVGLLLDTFLVRTITVPAMASLVGRANWWPSRSGSTTHQLGGQDGLNAATFASTGSAAPRGSGLHQQNDLTTNSPPR